MTFPNHRFCFFRIGISLFNSNLEIDFLICSYFINFRSSAQLYLEFETLSGDEIKDLLMGKRPNRETIIEPLAPRNSTVPTAGAGRNRPRPEPGPMEPQPQA